MGNDLDVNSILYGDAGRGNALAVAVEQWFPQTEDEEYEWLMDKFPDAPLGNIMSLVTYEHQLAMLRCMYQMAYVLTTDDYDAHALSFSSSCGTEGDIWDDACDWADGHNCIVALRWDMLCGYMRSHISTGVSDLAIREFFPAFYAVLRKIPTNSYEHGILWECWHAACGDDPFQRLPYEDYDISPRA